MTPVTARLVVRDPTGQDVLGVERGAAVREDRPDVLAALRGQAARGWTVVVDGRPVRAARMAARVRRGLVVVGAAPVAADVSIHDHLAALVGSGHAEDLLAGAPLLAGRGADPAGVLSGGERRLLAWLRAVALRPAGVVLDRAGRGLDTETLQWATGRVAAWRRDGVAVVVHAGRVEEGRWAMDAG